MTGKISLIVVMLVIGLPGMSGKLMSAQSEVNITASATAKGKPADVLFQKYCSICHGEKGNGKSRVIKSMIPPPRDFTSAQAAQELSRERMISSIKNGRPGTAMVSHSRKLSDKEIASIVDFIRTTFMQVPENKNFTASSQVAPITQQTPQTVASVPESKPAETSKQHKHGAELFKKNCASCHGDRGSTAIWARSGLNPAPRDFTSAQAKAELTRDRMINSVTNGRPGTAMMAFSSRLSSQDIVDVVLFIRSEFMKINDGPAAETVTSAPLQQAPAADSPPSVAMSGPADMNKGMPGDLKTDKAWGEEFYMNNCYVCHGKKGDGKGPRSHFITPRPRNFTTDESRKAYNRPRLFDAIKKGKRGTVMPAWGTVLSDQQIANVAEFVFQAFILAGGSDVPASEKTSEQGKKKASLTAAARTSPLQKN